MMAASNRQTKLRTMIELYIKSIDRRWKKEVAGGSRCNYILSPYITSKTAESVLSRSNGRACEVYTLFSAELFCSKASSLRTIRNLVEAGHKVFHLPGLHAKVFLVPGAFASIGSQNLTHAGTRHKEASVALFDQRTVDQVEKQIAPWLVQGVAITPEMISEMEEVLAHLEPQYQELLASAEKATQRVFQAQLVRAAQLAHEAQLAREEERLAAEERAQRAKVDEERKRAAEAHEQWLARVIEDQRRAAGYESQLQLQRERDAAAAQKQRIARFGINSRALPSSLSTARGVVSYRDSYRSNRRVTLAAQQERDLTSWRIQGAPCSFSHGKRYLIVHEESGKAGWGRIVKTRITFIGKGVGFSGFMHLGGMHVSISKNCDWSPSPDYGRNMFFEIGDEFGNVACTVSAWFDLTRLEILNIERSGGTKFPAKEQLEVIKAIKRNSDLVASRILKEVVAPFTYVARLHGDIAEDFFGPVGSAYSIRAAIVSGHPILVVASDR